MTHDVGELGTEGSIDGHADGTEDNGGNGDVGKSDTFGDEEGASGEVVLQGLERTELTLCEGGVDLVEQEWECCTD